MKKLLLGAFLLSALFLGCSQETETAPQYDVTFFIVSASYVMDEDSGAPEDFHELRTWVILNTDAELLEVWRGSSERRITDFLLTYSSLSRGQITEAFNIINANGHGLLVLLDGDDAFLIFVEKL